MMCVLLGEPCVTHTRMHETIKGTWMYCIQILKTIYPREAIKDAV